jgi:hypothetical protein
MVNIYFLDALLDADAGSVNSVDKEYARGVPSPLDSRRSGSDRYIVQMFK